MFNPFKPIYTPIRGTTEPSFKLSPMGVELLTAPYTYPNALQPSATLYIQAPTWKTPARVLTTKDLPTETLSVAGYTIETKAGTEFLTVPIQTTEGSSTFSIPVDFYKTYQTDIQSKLHTVVGTADSPTPIQAGAIPAYAKSGDATTLTPTYTVLDTYDRDKLATSENLTTYTETLHKTKELPTAGAVLDLVGESIYVLQARRAGTLSAISTVD